MKDETNEEQTTSEEQASASEVPEEVGTDDTGQESEEGNVESTESEEGTESEGVDFEAELARERERLGKKVDKERDRRIAAERNSISRAEAEKIAKDAVAEAEKRIMKGQIEALAARVSNSTAEKDLILHHYHNSIVPTGNIEEDIAMARALANRKRMPGAISETRVAEKSQNTRLGGSEAGAPVKTKTQPKYSKDILDAAAFAGKTPEEFVKGLGKEN